MARSKKKFDYTSFRLDKDDVMHEAIMRCYREMYKRAQPSADFDKLMKQYNKEVAELMAQGMSKEDAQRKCTFYERYYLSHKEFCYITDKYLKAYRFETVWDDHMQLIIDEAKNGYSDEVYGVANWEPKRIKFRYYLGKSKFWKWFHDKEKYDKYEWFDKLHTKIIKYLNERDLLPSQFDGSRHYEDRQSLKKQVNRRLFLDIFGWISEWLSKVFIDFLENRKWHYRFNWDENQFRGATALGGSPTGNAKVVEEYWAKQGVKVKIDPREYSSDYFYSEEFGDLDEYLEYWNPDGSRKEVATESEDSSESQKD